MSTHIVSFSRPDCIATMYRPFLRLGVFAFLAAFASACSVDSDADSESAPPNILFLLADDLQADAIGAYGNGYIRTPNLDRLVEDGYSFRRAYNMGAHHGAVCAPSRAMTMSGRSLFHVYDNLDSVRTFPEILREANYRTFGTGKWHQSRSSFTRSFGEGRAVFFGGMANHFSIRLQDLQADGTFSEPVMQGFSTTLFADAAVDFLENYGASDREAPFLAYVSFTVPHDPRTPPANHAADYAGADMPLPPNYMPVHPFDNGRMKVRDEVLAAWPRRTDVIRDQLAEYYGLITHMDEEIGRILGALHAQGLTDNTVVVFASDHGLAVGRHGLLGKQNLYEHSAKTPLVVQGPGIPQGETDALVYLHDLFATVLGLAGVEAPANVDAQDLSVLWKSDQTAFRERLFLAYEDLHRAVVEDRWKLIRYPKIHYTQLFDLEADPYELRNLADDPAYAEEQERLMTLLQSAQQEAADPHPLTSEPRMPMDFDYSDIVRTPDQWQPEEVVQKYF